jgi:hypothetical protein
MDSRERDARPTASGYALVIGFPSLEPMRMNLRILVVLPWLLLAAGAAQASDSASGLWVGEILLNKVNETVEGVDAANQVVAPDPSVPTPVAHPAHLRIILHVDANGQVRLLKSVAVLTKGTNQPPDVELVTDPTLYPNYSSIGQRITAVAYDFGDYNAVSILNLVATNAAVAAATGADPTNAANQVVQNAEQEAVPPLSPGYVAFIATPTFLSSADIAGGAAAGSLSGAGAASMSQAQKINTANAAALKALTDARVFAAADGVVVNEVPMQGTFAPSSRLTCTLYMGASHPTNPFRHRMNPDHTVGYSITRALTIQFDPANGTNAFQTVGFGVDRITGTYREEIQGLHKPLGPQQNVGLITEGIITLERISQVDTLNQ